MSVLQPVVCPVVSAVAKTSTEPPRSAAVASTGNLLVDGNPILVDTFPIVFS